MQKKSILLVLMVFISGVLSARDSVLGIQAHSGPYLGQKIPSLKPELFSPDVVSVKQGVHGNIVFSHDLSEAAWSPNYHVDDKSVLFLTQYKNGHWTAPESFYPRGEAYSHGEPFYSCDGNKLYFLSGEQDVPRGEENETIWLVEKTNGGWSEPRALSTVLDAFRMHWQFSFDTENNLYFGGVSSSDESGEIYYSDYENGRYGVPVRLPAAVNTSAPEFSPFISPGNAPPSS